MNVYLYTAHITYHVSWRFTILLSEIERQLVKAPLAKPNSVSKVGDQEISDLMEIANRFCHYFSNIGPNLAINGFNLPLRIRIFFLVIFFSLCS